MRGTIHHIDLTVTDMEASFPLYDAVLRFLGYEVVDRSATIIDWHHRSGDGTPEIGIVQAEGANAARPHDRHSPGLHHLAFKADRPEEVDRFHALLVEIGAEILDPPVDYPQYNDGRGYYAVFFADRDGLKLELAWTPPE